MRSPRRVSVCHCSGVRLPRIWLSASTKRSEAPAARGSATADVLLLDTSGLLAAIDSTQRRHADCAAVVAGRTGPFLLSPFVLAELDDLVATRVGRAAE